VTRKSFTGTHDDEFLGVPPTGRSVTINALFIGRNRYQSRPVDGLAG
jgi:predicted ester cyclase